MTPSQALERAARFLDPRTDDDSAIPSGEAIRLAAALREIAASLASQQAPQADQTTRQIVGYLRQDQEGPGARDPLFLLGNLPPMSIATYRPVVYASPQAAQLVSDAGAEGVQEPEVEHDALCLKVIRGEWKNCTCGATPTGEAAGAAQPVRSTQAQAPAVQAEPTIADKLGVDPAWADQPTPKPQEGVWTLTAPDGRMWAGESPLRACAAESRERVPAHVALARIARGCDESAAPAAPADAPQGDGAHAITPLRSLLGIVQRYLPPDGPSANEALSEIIGLVDPWPLAVSWEILPEPPAPAEAPWMVTDRAAVEATCRFMETNIAPRKCDSDGVSHCWRCNSVYLAKKMREVLASTSPAKNATTVKEPK